MYTAKEFGKTANKNRINAPTLDMKFLSWMSTLSTEKRMDHFVQWWEGWYEALDESILLQTGRFAKNHSQSSH